MVRADLNERLAAMDAVNLDEHAEGYRDGRDMNCPEPNANRSDAYKHSFNVGRAERANRPIPAVLSRLSAQQIRTSEAVKIITGERY